MSTEYARRPYSPALLQRPEPFPAKFILRSDAIKVAMEREAKEALEDMQRYKYV